jgi:hypothetical protein
MPKDSANNPEQRPGRRETGSTLEQTATPAENLYGWIPTVASCEEIHAALEKAFDYRGDVTITLKDGRMVDGYIFDRRSSHGLTLEECWIRMFPKDRDEKVLIRYSEIARLEFTGIDMAAGKSFEAWIRKYRERKALGEKNISLEPEHLED